MIRPLLGITTIPATEKLVLKGTWRKSTGEKVSGSSMPTLGDANIVILDGRIFLFSQDRKNLFVLNGNASSSELAEAKKLVKVLDKNTQGNVIIGNVEGRIRSNNCLVIANSEGSKVDIARRCNSATIVFSNGVTLSPYSKDRTEDGDASNAFVGNSQNCTQTYSVNAKMLYCDGTWINDTDQITVIGHEGSYFEGMEGSFFLNTDPNNGRVIADDSCNTIGINVHNVELSGSTSALIKDLADLEVDSSARALVVGKNHPGVIKDQPDFSNLSGGPKYRTDDDADLQVGQLRSRFSGELIRNLRELLDNLTSNPDADLSKLRASWFSPKSIATLVKHADSLLKS